MTTQTRKYEADVMLTSQVKTVTPVAVKILLLASTFLACLGSLLTAQIDISQYHGYHRSDSDSPKWLSAWVYLGDKPWYDTLMRHCSCNSARDVYALSCDRSDSQDDDDVEKIGQSRDTSIICGNNEW